LRRTIKSKRWPWLTEGWEVVEEAELDSGKLRIDDPYPTWFDLGYATKPADLNIWSEKNET
jgi:hypothetical protein